MNLKLLGAVLLVIAFSNIKKSMLMNLEIPGAVILLIPFSNI